MDQSTCWKLTGLAIFLTGAVFFKSVFSFEVISESVVSLKEFSGIIHTSLSH